VSVCGCAAREDRYAGCPFDSVGLDRDFVDQYERGSSVITVNGRLMRLNRWSTTLGLALLNFVIPLSTTWAGESNLVLPDLKQSRFLGDSISGYTLLLVGLLVCAGGLGFGLVFYRQLKNLRKRSAECSNHRNRLALRAEGPC